jgi:hypothetical protein
MQSFALINVKFINPNLEVVRLLLIFARVKDENLKNDSWNNQHLSR